MQPSDGRNLWQPQEGEQPIAPPTPNVQPTTQPTEQISWEASENISHERDGLWFMGFGMVFLALIGVSIWLEQWTFTVLLVIMAIALVVYIKRPPRVLHYTLSNTGLNVGEQFHDYSEFRSFGVLQQGGIFSVMLMPTKRFGQALTIYFTESDGEKIVDILGSRLPMEDLHLDMMDNLLRRLRL